MTTELEYINSNETANCPICRTNGEYMDIYITEVVRPEEVITEEDENNNYFSKMMEYVLSTNYTLTTVEESMHLNFKDRNISKSNFVEAYYGTEYSYIDGNPKFVDVTKRVAMALAFNKSHLIIEKNNLIHNVYLEQAINEKFFLFIVLRS
tara:strand:- start:109 stop:561 length:453 start_codon:yes stop_codon:yes gene_type:complete